MSGYGVVGCRHCRALWVLADDTDTEHHECPRCGRTHPSERLRTLERFEAHEQAAEYRAHVLAERAHAPSSDAFDSFEAWADYGTLEAEVQELDPTTTPEHDQAYLEAQATKVLDAPSTLPPNYDPAYLREEVERLEQTTTLPEGYDAAYLQARVADRDPIALPEEAPSSEYLHQSAQRHLQTLEPDPPHLDVEGAGLTLAEGQTTLADSITIGPRRSEWLGALLERLQSPCKRIATRFESPRPLIEEHGVTAGHWAYASALHEWATKEKKTPPDLLTRVGQGQAPEDCGFEALERGPLAVLALAATPTTVRVVFDSSAWLENTNNRTQARTLEALAMFGQVLRVELVVSPAVRAHLREAHPDWTATHLTRERDGSPQPSDPTHEHLTEAWDAIEEYRPDTGIVRTLAQLPQQGARAVPAIQDDPVIDRATGSVDRYLGQLEANSLIAVDRRRTHNRISLTSRGRAAQALITPDFRLLHPDTAKLDSCLTEHTHSNVGTVSPAARPAAPTTEGMAPDAWLAETGQPTGQGGFTRWLGDDGRCDPHALHSRLAAGKRMDGITCLDERIAAFDDGRVSYLGCREDHLQVVTQWGGSLPTLVRLAATLASGQVWGRVLTREAVGDELEGLFDTHVTDADRLRLLQSALQVGWTPTDAADYETLRDRLHEVGQHLLGRLGECSDDREALYRDAHGLLASMTALLHRLDIEVTIHLRVPDTANLRGDETRYGDFLGFLRQTVPKQATYGPHSLWRQLFETREAKLRKRHPIEVDTTDPAATHTASVVITGPDAEAMVPDIRDSLEELAERAPIRDGTERSVTLDIPVVSGTAFGAVKLTVKARLEAKGYHTTPETTSKATRLLVGLLGTEPGHASPSVVADALHAIDPAPGTTVTTAALERALGSLPAHRLVPDAPESVQAMLTTLLAAGPCTPEDLQQRTSRASYHRHIETLEAVGIVVHTAGQWQVAIDPSWAPDDPGTRPDQGHTPTEARARTRELLAELAGTRQPDGEPGRHHAEGAPPLETCPQLLAFVPWVQTLLAGPPPQRPPTHVQLGRPPTETSPAQQSLTG